MVLVWVDLGWVADVAFGGRVWRGLVAIVRAGVSQGVERERKRTQKHAGRKRKGREKEAEEVVKKVKAQRKDNEKLLVGSCSDERGSKEEEPTATEQSYSLDSSSLKCFDQWRPSARHPTAICARIRSFVTRTHKTKHPQ